ncbi:hypothetical protein HELRODRAFT_160344 [Helobdella robusta]|uniref:Uncharacterized protein n=1 Tax=Helobdella robusta TaxID=6412 RepID=T1EQ44_HELRO|nr:hypothetical protein HELRODRAFT_160344 [Helobdella robusta]ESO06190.1 hypothetical protein HELRODRAFT_160344 [Helobdella robusta]
MVLSTELSANPDIWCQKCDICQKKYESTTDINSCETKFPSVRGLQFIMSSYKHLSGSEKRKRKADRDKVAEQMKGSLNKFLIVEDEKSQQSSSFSQILPAQTPEASHECESIQQKYQREKLSNSDCEDEAKEDIYIKSSESNDETESFVNDIAL